MRARSFVALCESNRDAPLVQPPADSADEPRVRTPGTEKDADIDELLKNMKGIPGVEPRECEPVLMARSARMRA